MGLLVLLLLLQFIAVSAAPPRSSALSKYFFDGYPYMMILLFYYYYYYGFLVQKGCAMRVGNNDIKGSALTVYQLELGAKTETQKKENTVNS